jgi:hypothetical protein
MIEISKPVTTLTDFALGTASLAFAYLLSRTLGPRNVVSRWIWCAGFITSGIAALLGATYHGFKPYFDAGTDRTFWSVIMYMMGASAGLMLAACHAADVRKDPVSMKRVLSGIGVSLAGALIQSTGFRHEADFNHNDVYHVIQILGLYLLFKAAAGMRDRSNSLPNDSQLVHFPQRAVLLPVREVDTETDQ